MIAQLSQLCDLVFQKTKRVAGDSGMTATVSIVGGVGGRVFGVCGCVRVWVEVQLSVCL